MTLKLQRLKALTSRYAALRVVLVGDIALDRYLHIDPLLAETSLETGLPVHNVTAVRAQPGAGGNVLANLAALGPRSLTAVGFSGDDGEGFELRRALEAIGVDLRHFLVRHDRATFTYTKPLVIRAGRLPEELSRLDIRSRTPTPTALEDEIVARLAEAVREADVIVAMDQVPEPGSGALTRRVKAELAALAARYPEKVFMADSRTSIGDFRDVRIKVNRSELARHFGVAEEGADMAALARRWAAQIGRDVFVTLGEDGILAASKDEVAALPGVPVEPPIDICGAGDAVLAGIAMALGAGATIAEAAEMGNLAGAIVVKKIGTTGTATVAELAALCAVLPTTLKGDAGRCPRAPRKP
jgi:rfaE bifunctional protein kinase chain/domain